VLHRLPYVLEVRKEARVRKTHLKVEVLLAKVGEGEYGGWMKRGRPR
jgi:hypothetical protein